MAGSEAEILSWCIPTAATTECGLLVNTFKRNKNSFAHNAHLNTEKGLLENTAKTKRMKSQKWIQTNS